jgi:hypothetical protein
MRTTLSYYQRTAGGAACAVIYFAGTHVLAVGYIGAFGLAWLGRGRAVLTHLTAVGRAASPTSQGLCP